MSSTRQRRRGRPPAPRSAAADDERAAPARAVDAVAPDADDERHGEAGGRVDEHDRADEPGRDVDLVEEERQVGRRDRAGEAGAGRGGGEGDEREERGGAAGRGGVRRVERRQATAVIAGARDREGGRLDGDLDGVGAEVGGVGDTGQRPPVETRIGARATCGSRGGRCACRGACARGRDSAARFDASTATRSSGPSAGSASGATRSPNANSGKLTTNSWLSRESSTAPSLVDDDRAGLEARAAP